MIIGAHAGFEYLHLVTVSPSGLRPFARARTRTLAHTLYMCVVL